MRLLTRCLAVVLLCLCAPFADGQIYTSIVVFGDSLSDTGNVAHLVQAKYGVRAPGPAYGYTDGRFTDGKDTTPAATLYTGVWIEQLAATLSGMPVVRASLDGGTNYAFGGAFTSAGTSALNFGGATLQIENVGQQVTDYLAAHPTVPAGTLVVVWAGANDLLNATSAAAIPAAVTSETAAVQRLIAAGATNVLVVNLPPLGAIPRLNATSGASTATASAQTFNTQLASAVAPLVANTALNVKLLDVYSLFGGIVAAPAANGFTNVTASSQGNTAVNPDMYLFWDDLHPTTAGHHLLALAAAALLAPPPATVTATLSPSSVLVRAGSSTGSAVTVTPADGFLGTVKLTCGNLPLYASCTIAPSTLKFTNSSSATQTAAILILTNNTAAAALFPLLGLGALFGRRRRSRPAVLVVLALASAGLLGFVGCGDSGKTTPAGTYTVQITATPSSGAATTLPLTLVVQ